MRTHTEAGVDADQDTGYRYIAGAAAAGDQLDHSNEWDGDEPTDIELPGTCCWKTFEQAVEYARWSAGTIAKVGGVLVGRGDLPGECLLDEAVVLQVWTRASVNEEWR